MRHKVIQNKPKETAYMKVILRNFVRILIATAGCARGNYIRNSENNMKSDGSK